MCRGQPVWGERHRISLGLSTQRFRNRYGSHAPHPPVTRCIDRTTLAEYDALDRCFNPTQFDADAWVRIAKVVP